jgi:hypothetical protein
MEKKTKDATHIKRTKTTALALSLIPAAGIAFGQTGTPGIDPFDQMMNNLRTRHSIQGGSIAWLSP